MSQGEIYVPPMARSVGRESNVNGSSGQHQGGYYIHWEQGGITGKNWTCIEGHLQSTGWPSWANSHNVEGTFDNFVNYINGTLTDKDGVSIPFAGNLDDILGAWNSLDKLNFIVEFGTTLGTYETGQPSNGACIEAIL